MKNNFSTRIRGLREDRSQAEFSRKIGVKQTTYSAWERGVSEPSHDMLRQISNIFFVSVDYLLGISDSRSATAPDPAALAKIAELEAEIVKLNAALAEKDGIIQGLKMAFDAVGKRNH